MSAWLSWLNAKWRLEAKAPSETTICDEVFRYVDGERLDPENINHRSFTMLWTSSEPDDSPTDLYDRWCDQTLALEVYYRVGVNGLGAEDAHKLILEDRDDVNACLRDPDLWAGYSDAQSGASTGLQNRVRVAEEIDRTEGVWIYRAVWRCKVQEVES